jgi:ElaB/YqjD/DUF883 family membrane-anchored ribosome-binding protein
MASIPTQGPGVGTADKGTQSESSGATDQARDKAGEVAGQAQEKAQELAGQAGEQAKQAAGQAKDRMREQVDQRSTQAGEQVTSQASDIRTVAEQLREQGKDKPAQLAEQAADRVERVGSYLSESDADRILSDVEDFARRQPWAVIAGGIALGFAASRFLKASSSERYYSRSPQQLPNTSTRPQGTTTPADGPRTGAPLRPTGNGGPADTGLGGPPTSTGTL